jgi:hypothetical protein
MKNQNDFSKPSLPRATSPSATHLKNTHFLFRESRSCKRIFASNLVNKRRRWRRNVTAAATAVLVALTICSLAFD